MLRPKTGHPVTAGSHPESANGWRTVGGEGVALPTVEHSYHIDGRLGRGAVFGDGHPNDAVLILTALGRTNRLGEVDSTQDTGRNAARIYTDWVHRVIETENSSSHKTSAERAPVPNFRRSLVTLSGLPDINRV